MNAQLPPTQAVLAEAASLATLRAAIPGGVHRPGESAYAAALDGFSIADRPAPELVVTPTDAAGVAAAVRYARDAGLAIVSW